MDGWISINGGKPEFVTNLNFENHILDFTELAGSPIKRAMNEQGCLVAYMKQMGDTISTKSQISILNRIQALDLHLQVLLFGAENV